MTEHAIIEPNGQELDLEIDTPSEELETLEAIKVLVEAQNGLLRQVLKTLVSIRLIYLTGGKG